MPCRAVPKPAPLVGCRAAGAGLDAHPGFPCRRSRGTAGEKGGAASLGRAASATRPYFPPARLNPLFKRRRPAMIALISLTARPPAARAVAAHVDYLPCGGKSIKRGPLPDRLGVVGIPAAYPVLRPTARRLCAGVGPPPRVPAGWDGLSTS